MRHPKYCFLHYAVNFVCRVRFKGGVVIIYHKGGVVIIHHKGGVVIIHHKGGVIIIHHKKEGVSSAE